MSFGNWYILFALFLPASALVWIWLRDRFPTMGLGSARRFALPQDHGVASQGLVWDFFLKCFMSAGPLMMATAIVLFAGPRHLDVPKAKRELTNIEFCLDLSGSMMAKFGSGTRYDAAMSALNGFVAQRKGDAFGLTVFGNNAEHWIPLTTDPSAFECAVPFLNPRRLPPGYGGGTMIGLGLKKCQEVLVTRELGDRMIVLVSDGASFDLNGNKAEEIARSLRDDNIVVYSIHIGDGMTPPEVSTVTNITGGESFSPQDTQALQNVFRKIDSMEVAKLTRTYAEVLDWFGPFAIAGLSFIGLSLISLLGMRYTPW
ncbi:MAG: Ca-activated chloride channel family protein [Mariniblastus sp.]|jgi:Ca-activated chloride channel family protein